MEINVVQILDEAILRDHLDEPTNRMFDIWHEECLNYIKNDINVIVADRRQNPQLRDIPGEIDSASPAVFDKKIYLVLWLDSVSPPKPLHVTHELGHWILALQGYKSLVDPARTYGDIVINLNSLAQHPPLFTLQRSLGHEPQDMIDLKAKNDDVYLNEEKERNSQRWISDALLIADDLINCSEIYRSRLKNTLKKRFPNTNRFVRTIINTPNINDLHSPENNLKFCYKLTKELKLDKWTELDQISQIITHFNK